MTFQRPLVLWVTFFIWPSENQKIVFACFLEMSGSWLTMIIVFPFLFNFCRNFITISPVFESRFPVGSSARITSGSFARARAIATLCCSPPDNWLG